jgi:hypothetical protein
MKIPDHLLVPIRIWATAVQEKDFVNNGSGCQIGILQLRKLDPPPEVWIIKRSIISEFALTNATLEPMYKDFCGYTPEGRWVQRHKDYDVGDKKHVRFNVMVLKPEGGGAPIQDDIEISVEDGDVWRCNAGSVYHGTTTVIGSRPRIILSYGFLI